MPSEKTLIGLLTAVLAICGFLAALWINTTNNSIDKLDGKISGLDSKLGDKIDKVQYTLGGASEAVTLLNNQGNQLRDDIRNTYVIVQNNADKLSQLGVDVAKVQAQLDDIQTELRMVLLGPATSSRGPGFRRKPPIPK